MPFKDVVDIVESLAVIIAAAAAVFGIDAWRREHIGRRRIDLAEEVLALFYEVRMTATAIRSRFIRADEGSTREALDAETPEEKRRRDLAHVPTERFARYRPQFAKLSAMRFRFMAVYGAEHVTLFEGFDKYLINLLSAASALEGVLTIDEIGLTPEDYAPGEHQRNLIEARRAFFGSGDEGDKLKIQLDTLISNVERVCRKEIAKH